jgi:hypothetical protein
LQSLDLLDRGLVVRLSEQGGFDRDRDRGEHDGDGNDDGEKDRVVPTQAHLRTSSSNYQGPSHEQKVNVRAGTEALKGPERKNIIYQVHSSQAPKSRFKDVGAISAASHLTYTVRLRSWNCSCAAFAYEAFPGRNYSSWKPWLELNEEDDQRGGDGKSEVECQELEIGGLSFDGDVDGEKNGEEGRVPVCKHLLACLLAERWEGVLGVHVKEREIGREEMAGSGCEV